MTGSRYALAAVIYTLLPLTAAAQTGATIAGNVTDESKAVLPGVTVEASSPALIEGSRTAVTDGSGNFSITELRPGTYKVTFGLAGFRTVVREGLVLATGFTANVSVPMSVGGVAETITVTGASPVVDIQNTRTQTVVTAELLTSAPVGQRDMFALSALIVGAKDSGGTQDVGGSAGSVGGAIDYHGAQSQDSKTKIDGLNYNSLHGLGGGSMRLYTPNIASVQEVNLALGTGDAEAETAGAQTNFVPKEGGNRFTLTGITVFSSEGMASDNLSSDVRSRGVTSTGKVLKSWDNSVAIGGPISHDRLWFFVAPRFWGVRNRNPGAYYNLTQGTAFYTPDLSRPANADLWQRDVASRVTWQASQKHKITFSHNWQSACYCTYVASPTLAPEAFVSYDYPNHELFQSTWTYPATNRLLLQAGVSWAHFEISPMPTGNVSPNDIGVVDAGTGQLFNSVTIINPGSNLPYGQGNTSNPLNTRFSASYVTGSHAAKFGLQTMEGRHKATGNINKDLEYILFNGTPIQLIQFATPFTKEDDVRAIGLYGQDQWTLHRLTLNLGVRFDYFKGWVPAQSSPAGSWVPVRSYPAKDDIPNFKDITPRIGGAFDLFGNGKTAIKASYGIYVGSLGAGLTELSDPLLTSVTQTSRTWFDANRNYVPDCNLTNFGANGECGAIANNLFGLTVPGTTYADDVLHGWGNRTRSTQTSVSLQHELVPGWSANVGYFRTAYANTLAAVNAAVTASDYSSYCVTAPQDARLPGGGGYQVCGNVDVNPAKFGQVKTTIMLAKDLGVGDVTRVFNGVDASVSGRFGKGGQLMVGMSSGSIRLNDCALNATPNAVATGSAFLAGSNYVSVPSDLVAHPLAEAYCNVAPSWSKSISAKLNGVYPLPYGFVVSGVLQSLPGLQHTAGLTYTNAQVAPALGRNLAAGPNGTVKIQVLPPQTQFESRLNQLDLRLSKNFRAGHSRLKANFDVYNVFNESAVTGIVSDYGRNWLNGTRVMFGRLLKVGGEIDF